MQAEAGAQSSLRSETEHLRSQLDAATNGLEQARGEWEAALARQRELIDENAALARIVDDLQKQFQEVQAAHQQDLCELAGARERLNELRRELDEHRDLAHQTLIIAQRGNEHAEESTRWQVEAANQQKQVEQLRRELAAAGQSNWELDSRYSELSAVLAEEQAGARLRIDAAERLQAELNEARQQLQQVQQLRNQEILVQTELERQQRELLEKTAAIEAREQRLRDEQVKMESQPSPQLAATMVFARPPVDAVPELHATEPPANITPPDNESRAGEGAAVADEATGVADEATDAGFPTIEAVEKPPADEDRQSRLLEELRARMMQEDDAPAVVAAAPVVAVSPPATRQTPPAAARSTTTGAAVRAEAGSGSGDDESIESYMSRLLNRVRGSASGEGPARETVDRMRESLSIRASQSLPAPPAESATPTAEAASGGGEIDPSDPINYVPRSQAPEQTLNMTAMRELANSHAHGSLRTATRKQATRKAARQSAIGTLSFAGFGLLGLTGYLTESLLASLASTVFLGMAVFQWTKSAAVQLKSLRLEPPAAQMEDETTAEDIAVQDSHPAEELPKGN